MVIIYFSCVKILIANPLKKRYQLKQKYCFVISKIKVLLHRFGSTSCIPGRGLKGKQVKILYSPAAVSSINVLNNTFATDYSGRRSKTGVSQKTCHSLSIFRSFRGKSDETSANDFSFAIVRSFSGAI